MVTSINCIAPYVWRYLSNCLLWEMRTRYNVADDLLFLCISWTLIIWTLESCYLFPLFFTWQNSGHILHISLLRSFRTFALYVLISLFCCMLAYHDVSMVAFYQFSFEILSSAWIQGKIYLSAYNPVVLSLHDRI